MGEPCSIADGWMGDDDTVNSTSDNSKTCKLPFLWLDVFTFLWNKLNFIIFFLHEKKISQILERLARKWNTLEQNGLVTVVTYG